MPESWEEEAPRPEEEEEEAGGPVKSFLEHLEDLRWVLIKSVAAVLITMLVCLFGAGKLVVLLKKPLEDARKATPRAEYQLSVWLHTNLLQTFYFNTNQIDSLGFQTSNKVIALEVTPVTVGTNQLLALRALPSPPHKLPNGPGPNLIFLDPIAPFMSSLKIAFFGGLILSLPLLIYFVGDFVVPALKTKEKKYFFRAMVFSSGLFLLGTVFAFTTMLPLVLRAAEAYSHWMGVDVVDWRAETYFSTVVMLMLAMGLAFELPIVLLSLVKIGILDYPKLVAARRYSVVIAAVVGALLTPPDVVSQIMMAVPLLLLYEITIWIAWYWHRQEKRREAREPKAAEVEDSD